MSSVINSFMWHLIILIINCFNQYFEKIYKKRKLIVCWTDLIDSLSQELYNALLHVKNMHWTFENSSKSSIFNLHYDMIQYVWYNMHILEEQVVGDIPLKLNHWQEIYTLKF